MTAWKKMERVFETKEELTGYITGRVKGGFICTVDGLPTFMPASQVDVRPLKRVDHLMNTPIKVIATRIDKKIEAMFVRAEERCLKKVRTQKFWKLLKILKKAI